RAAGVAQRIAPLVAGSVVNAGDGAHEHPTQALLDMLTIRRQCGTLAGLCIAIVGDITHSRVARSNIRGLTKMGAEVRVAGPATMLPPHLDKLGAKVYPNVEEAITDVDVVMCLRIQRERQNEALLPSLKEYARFFGVDHERLKRAKNNALVLHPGPINRGVEISSGVADGDRSCILAQVTNGLAIRTALFYLLAGKGDDHAAH
ncbi:MAG: aspartate carbamoyltransferase, partial [Chitinivibrionales bacterium]|nr:aspartate carbamoyltransferase [Chitinivibrionales bacterium]